MNEAVFRFYDALNDFLFVERKNRSFAFRFHENPGIKDPIEAIGVPHTEVDLILVNGTSVDFKYRLQEGDQVAVYPLDSKVDISHIVRLREKPDRPAFILDVHLGKLARMLRFLGFDVRYQNHCADLEIAKISVRDGRIVLTRDRRLLFRKEIAHGYWLRSTDPDKQVLEILTYFDLRGKIASFHRCALCNDEITWVDKAEIIDRLEPKTKKYYDQFYRCTGCEKIYWKGSHYERIKKHFDTLVAMDSPCVT